jgi:hypothetical protein
VNQSEKQEGGWGRGGNAEASTEWPPGHPTGISSEVQEPGPEVGTTPPALGTFWEQHTETDSDAV